MKSSKKNMKLAPNSRFFPELELLEQDAFGTTRWWSCYSFWSGALTNTPLVSIFAARLLPFRHCNGTPIYIISPPRKSKSDIFFLAHEQESSSRCACSEYQFSDANLQESSNILNAPCNKLFDPSNSVQSREGSWAKSTELLTRHLVQYCLCLC